MQYINSPVSTLCIGQASSMGSFLLAAGEKGKDTHYQILELWYINHPLDFKGKLPIYKYMLKKFYLLKERLNKIYSKHTGKSVSEISDAL